LAIAVPIAVIDFIATIDASSPTILILAKVLALWLLRATQGERHDKEKEHGYKKHHKKPNLLRPLLLVFLKVLS